MAATWEVADVFRRHGDTYRRMHDGHLGRVERRVMSAVALCRTAALGGHAERCADCGFVRNAYNSCRNRHCPKCQGHARAAWLAAQQAELLPVPYFHVVFTVPAPAAEIAFQNKQTVYAILFRTAAETLRRIAADPKHLGAEIGLVAVLHTWGQTLQHHPHVHCVVPGGGPSPDGTRWVACRPGFFLPVRVLSRLFRRLFLDELRAAFDAGQLGWFGDLADLAEPARFARRLRDLRRAEWVVYAKPPFGGPEQVLAYLGRYTHRVAIANSRLMTVTEDDVAFRWKDYRHHGKSKVMALDADEFIRRFLLHTLPDGFHRIRHYGFLANGHRAAKLALCRELLAARPIIEPATLTEASHHRVRSLPLLRRRDGYVRHTPATAAATCLVPAGHLVSCRHPRRPGRPAATRAGRHRLAFQFYPRPRTRRGGARTRRSAHRRHRSPVTSLSRGGSPTLPRHVQAVADQPPQQQSP